MKILHQYNKKRRVDDGVNQSIWNMVHERLDRFVLNQKQINQGTLP